MSKETKTKKLTVNRDCYDANVAVIEAAILENPEINYHGANGIIALVRNNIIKTTPGKGCGKPIATGKLSDLLAANAGNCPLNSSATKIENLIGVGSSKFPTSAPGFTGPLVRMLGLGKAAEEILKASEERSMGHHRAKSDRGSLKAKTPEQKKRSRYSGIRPLDIKDVRGRGR